MQSSDTGALKYSSAESLQGINIFSGEKGLGGALTNPTELARRKGSISQGYPVLFAGRQWIDVETAYHALHKPTPQENDALMIELISAKFHQHPALLQEIKIRGGKVFLTLCDHMTGARSEGARSWEGRGLESRFIRNLVAAFENAQGSPRTEEGQQLLF